MMKTCVGLSLLPFHEIINLLQPLLEEVVIAQLVVDFLQLSDDLPHVLVLQVVFRVLRQDLNLEVVHLALLRDDFLLWTDAHLTVLLDQFRICLVFCRSVTSVGLG